MKICVYAIAKNEEENIDKWYESMREADEIYVMVDGTSTDKTYEKLKSLGVHVEKKTIQPWRFDTARNESLKMVPKDADICVCTDLDEVFTPGWRKILENSWQKDTNIAYYDYYHNAGSPNDTPNIFKYYKIHDRNNFIWKWPVHEYIVKKNKNKKINSIMLDNVMLKHYPKNKVRNYTEILQEAVKQTPNDKRMLTLLSEAFLACKNYDDAEKYLLKLRNFKNLYKDSYHFCLTYKLLIQLERSRENYNKAIQYGYEAMSKIDYCKTILCELATALSDSHKDFEISTSLFKKALNIKNFVINEREHEWKDDSKILNYISMNYFYLKEYEKAIEYVDQAINNTNNGSIMYKTYISNKIIYENALNC